MIGRLNISRLSHKIVTLPLWPTGSNENEDPENEDRRPNTPFPPLPPPKKIKINKCLESFSAIGVKTKENNCYYFYTTDNYYYYYYYYYLFYYCKLLIV